MRYFRFCLGVLRENGRVSGKNQSMYIRRARTYIHCVNAGWTREEQPGISLRRLRKDRILFRA